MIIIFMEFIDQLIDYPINCASLRWVVVLVHSNAGYDTFPSTSYQCSILDYLQAYPYLS